MQLHMDEVARVGEAERLEEAHREESERLEEAERLEDHAVGVELQLVELVERKERAKVQGREAEAAQLEGEIQTLQQELAATAERLDDDGGTEAGVGDAG